MTKKGEVALFKKGGNEGRGGGVFIRRKEKVGENSKEADK